MKNDFDLDRLAVPLSGRGGGRTTSDIVSMLSNLEFSEKDVVIWTRQSAMIHFYMKMILSIGRRMGFHIVQNSPYTCKVEGKTIAFKHPTFSMERIARQNTVYFLSMVTKELCTEEYFNIAG